MQKFIISAITLSVVIFLIAATFGILNNSHYKITDMPEDIRYHITIDANIWPDQLYASSYSSKLDSYWTFEPSKYPFGGPVWTYHSYEYTLTDVNFRVNQITR
jgi:hypothetical protein